MSDPRTGHVVAIGQRLACATQAADARKAHDYAACFTPEGVLELDVAHEGRAAIIAWMTAPSPFAAPADGSPGFISHHLTTCRIDLTGEDTATVRTYWLVTSATGLDHNGYYVDRFERIDGDWLIAHRRPRTLWISPTSVMRRGD